MSLQHPISEGLLISKPLPLALQWDLWVCLAIALYICSALYSGYGTALRSLPGPGWARFSRLWLANMVAGRKTHDSYRQLHEKYGKIVRTGPYHVSISDPAAIPLIYDFTSSFKKSNFYTAMHIKYNGTLYENVFVTKKLDVHKQLRSTVAQAYSITNLKPLELLIDATTKIFTEQMDDLAGQDIDLGNWLQWWAFDTIGQLTFSRSFGFMKERRDMNKIIEGIDTGAVYSSVIGQIPSAHKWLVGNEKLLNILMALSPSMKKQNIMPIVEKMSYEQMGAHKDTTNSHRGDLLEFLRKIQERDPQNMTDSNILVFLSVNIIAGSDTTAMSLRAIFYNLIKNPSCYRKLVSEIENADRLGQLSEYIKYDEALKLEYLQAVIKEAIRVHPGIGLVLERVVPEGGATLCDVRLPAGTYVGINAWSVNYSTAAFGEDAYEFRPERWLEADAASLKGMEKAIFTFGGGSRVCLGKNISLLEINKFVPHVLRRYDLHWSGPHAEWTIRAAWLAKQTNFIARLTPKVKV